MYCIGIDASRNRSGGAKAHIIGILNNIDITSLNISTIHVWTYTELAKQLPKYSWLVVHTPEPLDKSLFHQMYWQFFTFSKILKQLKVDILLSTDAGTLCDFVPSVVMSRDMLSYEPGEMDRYFFSLSWIRLFILKYVQAFNFKKAEGVIFLTNYARKVITVFTGQLSSTAVVNHGVSEDFRSLPKKLASVENLKFIYVSNSDKYKHQDSVIKAFVKFRDFSKLSPRLSLIGASSGPCAASVLDTMNCYNAGNKDIIVSSFVKHSEVPELLKNHDVFIFASSCENMPNTLIEAMASGLPIMCSNRGPMPEVLTERGIYFDPEDVDSIVEAFSKLTSNVQFLNEQAQMSYEVASNYSWNRCSKETLSYLIGIIESSKSNGPETKL